MKPAAGGREDGTRHGTSERSDRDHHDPGHQGRVAGRTGERNGQPPALEGTGELPVDDLRVSRDDSHYLTIGTRYSFGH